MSEPGRCPMCSRHVGELNYSHALGGVCCERCHCQAAPPASPAALAYRPPRPSRRGPTSRRGPKPTAYARLVDRVYAALGRVGEVFSLGGGRLTGRCPVCREGAVVIRLIDDDPPFLRCDGCDAGCDAERIARRL